jgi:hypothetical protein
MELAAKETVTVATGAWVTVIVALPLCPSLVAVMLAVPTETPVTTPVVADTVATAVLPDVQVIVRPVSGLPFASKVVALACDVPTAVIEVGARDTVTDATGATVTVIADAPFFPSLVAVIVALPAATAVTNPFASTVAAAELSDAQLRVRPVSRFPFPSLVSAVSCRDGVILRTSVAALGLTVTDATGIGFTVIVGVGVELTDSLVAVIVAVPTPTAVTVVGEPLALTVSTAVLLETQFTVRPVSAFPFASFVVAVSCCV